MCIVDLTISYKFQSHRGIRPYNVSFALPKEDPIDEVGEDNEDIIIDQFDVVDEKVSLLQVVVLNFKI